MPVCVLLKNAKKIMIFRNSWCDGVENDANTVSVGTNPWKLTKVFHSPSQMAEANFALPLSPVFNARKTACYEGHVLHITGTAISQ